MGLLANRRKERELRKFQAAWDFFYSTSVASRSFYSDEEQKEFFERFQTFKQL